MLKFFDTKCSSKQVKHMNVKPKLELILCKNMLPFCEPAGPCFGGVKEESVDFTRSKHNNKLALIAFLRRIFFTSSALFKTSVFLY